MSKITTREVLFEKMDVSSNITYLFLIENLENMNIKTKKIELTHYPVTQSLQVYGIEILTFSPSTCNKFLKFCPTTYLLYFSTLLGHKLFFQKNNLNGNTIFNI